MTPTVTFEDQHAAWHDDVLKLHRGRDYGEVSNNRQVEKSPEKQPFCFNLPQLSDEALISGVSNPASSKRGGARNRADRESEGIAAKQLGNLIAATHHAAAIGLPFTRMITIHWQEAGVALENMVKATGEFIGLLTKALKRWGSGTAWLYVHEGGERKGGHCHMLVHVPAALVAQVAKAQKRWLRNITGVPYRRRVIHSRPIGGRLGVEKTSPDLHATNLERVLLYLLKGAGENAAKAFDLIRLEYGGLVIGKRCGTSQSIGAKARSISEARR